MASAGNHVGAFVAAGRALRYADGAVIAHHPGTKDMLKPLLYGGADAWTAYQTVRQHALTMPLRAATAA